MQRCCSRPRAKLGKDVENDVDLHSASGSFGLTLSCDVDMYRGCTNVGALSVLRKLACRFGASALSKHKNIR